MKHLFERQRTATRSRPVVASNLCNTPQRSYSLFFFGALLVLFSAVARLKSDWED
jgi:hypothetical protein